MPPCLDVYVWVRTRDKAGVLSRFIARYVDADQPREPRFDAWALAYLGMPFEVDGQPGVLALGVWQPGIAAQFAACGGGHIEAIV